MLERGHAVKHGVTVFGGGGKNSFWIPVMGRTEEGGLEAATTWQVRRSEFDSMLLDAALDAGADLMTGEATEPIVEGDAVTGVRVRTASGETIDVKSDVLIDASGRKTWLANAGVVGPKIRDKYDSQIAVFSHVRGALRDPGESSGNTLILYEKLLHWAWFIPLDDEVVSIGVVTPVKHYRATKESKEEFFLREIQEMNPELTRRLDDIELVEVVRTASNYSYFVDRFTGPGYVCVGDSHRFIDPIFSFGLYLTIADAEMAGGAIAAYLEGNGERREDALRAYEDRSNLGLGVLQDLIDSFWSNPLAFGYLAHFTDHRDGMIDFFAGRIYPEEPTPTQLAMRRIIEVHEEEIERQT